MNKPCHEHDFCVLSGGNEMPAKKKEKLTMREVLELVHVMHSSDLADIK